MNVFEGLGTLPNIHENDKDKREFVKSCAYCDIARAMGKDYEKIPDIDEVQEWL